jgi:energy-coupling factor transporter transmembrane protein EcfT
MEVGVEFSNCKFKKKYQAPPSYIYSLISISLKSQQKGRKTINQKA